LLALFLLSGSFDRFREIQKKYTKKIEKIINPVIIYYYNDRSGSDREFCASLSFLDYFLLVFTRSTPLLPSYWVVYH